MKGKLQTLLEEGEEGFREKAAFRIPHAEKAFQAPGRVEAHIFQSNSKLSESL